MEKVAFDYSLKNIPIPPRKTFIEELIFRTQIFIQNLRWAAFWISKKDKDHERKQTYGFKTEKSAPANVELDRFEFDLLHLIRNLEFRKISYPFQNEIKKDVKKIKSSKKVYLQADKTSNMYLIDKDKYKKLLRENVTQTYKAANDDLEEKINKEAKKFTDKLKISERVEKIAEKEAYITLKDHKENFENDLPCRLINPAKSNIGKITSDEIKKINKTIREKTKLNQWRSTSEALNWFKGIVNKGRKQMLQLDIENFYPSISKNLLNLAIKYAQTITDINQDVVDMIHHARKSILFHDGRAWRKNKSLYDVTMGSFDGAEICEMVGLYILHCIKEKVPEIEFGLYRDDGLGFHKSGRKATMERTKKKLIQIFKNLGLKITIETNMTQVNFLDVSMHINGEFWPYQKANNTTKYINTQSNHPKVVLKQIKNSVENRLRTISCNQNQFDRNKRPYEKALRESGHKNKLEFKDPSRKKKRNRNKKAIWYNPPFNLELKTNIGEEFLKLVRKHFDLRHPFHKDLNIHTIKFSYSCTSNMENIIKGHNKKILKEPEIIDNDKCNCIVKDNCPLQKKCLEETIVYKAEITANNQTKNYIGITENAFKERFGNHKNSFINEKKKNDTALSKKVWELGIRDPNIKWSIIEKSSKFKAGSRKCRLCLAEAYHILNAYNDRDNLNIRSEIFSLCTHRNSKKLSRIKD